MDRPKGSFELMRIHRVPVYLHWSFPVGATVPIALAKFDPLPSLYFCLGYVVLVLWHERQNKWINNPKPVDPPRKEDFCFVIPWSGSAATPARPVSLSATGWRLEEYHAARLEHARDTYRLYQETLLCAATIAGVPVD